MTDAAAPRNVTATLAAFAVSTHPQDIPVDAFRVARHCLLDWIGCTLAGASEPAVEMLVAEIESQGGRPQASIIGRSLRASLPQAALVNGTASHVLDFDDVHHAMNGHPSAPVIPAVLALAEHVNVAGGDMLAAIAVAMEVECRIGAMLGPTHHRRGFNPAGTAGAFGAAVGAGRMLGLSAAQMEVALGLAGAQAAAMQSMVRSMAMPLHSGKAAANGIFAASLAQRGFTASRTALDGPQGYPAMTSDRSDTSLALDGLGERWIMMDIVFKYHVACYGAHPAIEAAREISAGERFDAGAVERVTLRVSSFIGRLCNVGEPADPIGMKFSLPQNVAMVFAGRDTGSVASYSRGALADDIVARLRSRVAVSVDESFADWRTAVEVSFRDRRAASAVVQLDRPCRDLALQERRLAAKFFGLAAPVVGEARAAEIVDCVAGITEAQCLARLLAHLGESGSHASVSNALDNQRGRHVQLA